MDNVYWSVGKKPDKDKVVKETDKCNTCVLTSTTVLTKLAFDSDKDARTAWRIFARPLVTAFGRQAWKRAWDKFKCTSPDCDKKKDCGKKPIYVEVGSRSVDPPAGGAVTWRLYLRVVREIQCIKAEQQPKDVAPDLPDPPTEEDGGGDDGGGDFFVSIGSG